MTINIAQYPPRVAAMIRLLVKHKDEIAGYPTGRKLVFNLGNHEVEIERTLKEKLPHE